MCIRDSLVSRHRQVPEDRVLRRRVRAQRPRHRAHVPVHLHQLVHGLRPALAPHQEPDQQMAHVRQHRVVRAGRVHRVQRALHRLRHHLRTEEVLHQDHVRHVLVHREQRQRGEQRAARGARRGRRREVVGLLARTVPLLAPVVQRRQVRPHVRGRPVDHLRPHLVELFGPVAQAARHRQLRDVRDGVARGEQRRLLGDLQRLLQDDPEVVAPGRRGPPRLLHQELGVHRRPARVLRRVRPPGPQPRPADARPLPELQGGRARERLHALPAHLAVLAGPGEQLRGRLPVLGGLHDVQHVEQVLVGPRQPHVLVLLRHESVRRRVRRVGRSRRGQPDAAAPAAQQVGAEDAEQQPERDEEPENLHASIVQDTP